MTRNAEKTKSSFDVEKPMSLSKLESKTVSKEDSKTENDSQNKFEISKDVDLMSRKLE